MPSNLLEVFTNCYGRYGVRAAIDLAPQAGITHLELAMKPHGGVLEIPEDVVASEKMGDEGIQNLKKELDANGLTVISANGSDNLMDPDGFARIAERMRLAAAIGAKYFVGLGGEPAEEDRKDFFDKMGAIGDVAASHGLTIALETHPGITQNAKNILETMQALQHDAIRINFDTGNILFYNEGADVYEHLEAVMDYVVHMHLKDSRGGYRDWYFTAMGDGGAVDFARIGEITNNAGFYGPYSLEIEGIKGEPEPTLEQRHERVVRSVNHLRAVGFLEA